MEAVLTNEVDYVSLVVGIRLSKLQKRCSYIPNTYVYILTYQIKRLIMTRIHYIIWIIIILKIKN